VSVKFDFVYQQSQVFLLLPVLFYWKDFKILRQSVRKIWFC